MTTATRENLVTLTDGQINTVIAGVERLLASNCHAVIDNVSWRIVTDAFRETVRELNDQPDPHENGYDCDRTQLAGGDMTDDELANEVFHHPTLLNLTAAKERIRWLSRSLNRNVAPPPSETSTSGDVERLRVVLGEARDAVEFFERVKSASEAEKIAVGTDHWDRLEAAIRACAALSDATFTRLAEAFDGTAHTHFSVLPTPELARVDQD